MVPWPSVGAGSGWLFVGLGLWALLTGRLVTKREADIYIERATKAEGRNDELTRQNSELMAFARLGQSTFKALRDRAEENK